MSLYSVYYTKSEINIFQNVSNPDQTSIKLPKGYSFNNHVWAYLYNTETNNKIGYVIVNSYYVNTDLTTKGGYVTDNAILFIDNELPIGTINYIYNFYTPTNDTLIPPSTKNYAYPQALTDYYYGREIAISIDISPSETRTVNFFVK